MCKQGNESLLSFQRKSLEPLAGEKTPGVIVGHANAIKGNPFLGHADARLQVLLPDHPSFDLAVNIFTYDPGATLPFVETHIMEHGLLMLSGRGISTVWTPTAIQRDRRRRHLDG